MERLVINTRTWETPAQAKENFASALIEQRKGPLEGKINFVELFINENGQLAHSEFGEIKPLVEVKTPIDKLEFRAIEKLTRWANENDQGLAIWISPPYPGQEESRFIVYELKREGEAKTIDLHAVCGYHNVQECLAIAEQLLTFSPEDIEPIHSVETLRETPISFTYKPYPTWADFLKETIGPPNVWETIKRGDHIKNKEEILNISDPIIDEYFPKIATAYSYHEHLVIGARMEIEARRAGYEIQEVGPCGISPTHALSLLDASQTGPFNLLYSKLSTAEGYFSCPKCHKAIPSGRGITTCPHCGAKKEDYQTCT